MAKRHTDQSSSSRPAKLRYFEMEASDDTIQKALETFERMRRPVELLPPPPKRIANTAASPAAPSLYDELDNAESEEPTTAEQTDNDRFQGQRRKRGEGPVVDRNAAITPAEDVDFYPKDKTSLKDFCGAKNPSTDMDKCLVFCYFFQEILKLKPYGMGHVLSAFRHIGEPLPKDLAQTLRNMRGRTARGKGWLDFTNPDDIRVTTIGTNRVEHELGNADPAGGNGAK